MTMTRRGGTRESTVVSRVAKRGDRRGEEKVAYFQAPGETLVRGGGRLGWLEGVPFQTLRIDLFVDGAPSLHPLLVVVNHVLKLFQRFLLFFCPRFRAGDATAREHFDRIDGLEEGLRYNVQ